MPYREKSELSPCSNGPGGDEFWCSSSKMRYPYRFIDLLLTGAIQEGAGHLGQQFYSWLPDIAVENPSEVPILCYPQSWYDFTGNHRYPIANKKTISPSW